MNNEPTDMVTPFFRDGDSPSDPKVKKLIADVTKKLRVGRDRRNECEGAIRIQLQSVKGSSEFNKKIPAAGDIVKNAEIVHSSLKKARAAINTIGAPFQAVFDANTNYDSHKRYDDFMRLLNTAICSADTLNQKLIIPKGKKSRDINKSLAKTAADYIVTQFCDLGDTADGLSLSTKRLQNSVAKSFYEYLTGNKKVDLSGRIADFAPERLTLKGGGEGAPRAGGNASATSNLALAKSFFGRVGNNGGGFDINGAAANAAASKSVADARGLTRRK